MSTGIFIRKRWREVEGAVCAMIVRCQSEITDTVGITDGVSCVKTDIFGFFVN